MQGPHRMLIGGEWVEAASGGTFATIDPATGEEIAQVPYAEAEDVDRAVQGRARGFDDGPVDDQDDRRRARRASSTASPT